MKIKTNEASRVVIDWMVTKCEGIQDSEFVRTHMDAWLYSTDWSQGGPIIEREKLDLEWKSIAGCRAKYEWLDEPFHEAHGPTLLIAAMRCYVMSKLGDTVGVPEELP